jgi:hypothetical protein
MRGKDKEHYDGDNGPGWRDAGYPLAVRETTADLHL